MLFDQSMQKCENLKSSNEYVLSVPNRVLLVVE